MKIKFFVLAIISLLFHVSALSQSESMHISFDNDVPTYLFKSEKTSLSFVLHTNVANIEAIREKLESLQDNIELHLEPSETDGQYNGQLIFHHEAGKEYFHKIFVFIGVEHLLLKGRLIPIAELLTI